MKQSFHELFSLAVMSERPIDIALRLARERGWNQTQFAVEVGITPADVSNWKRRGLPPKEHQRVALALGVGVAELLEGTSNVEEAARRKRVPLISWVQAGQPVSVEDWTHPGDPPEWVNVYETAPSDNAFALRVVGDSMVSDNPDSHSFPPGTVLIVDPSRACDPGDFVIAKDVETQQANFKKLVQDGGRWFLKPLNRDYPTVEIDDPALRVIGRVVEFYRGGKL